MAAERAPAMDTLLLVFARAPRRGRVKTRLVPELGEAMRVAQDPLVGELLQGLTGVDLAGASMRFATSLDDTIWREIGLEEAAIRRNPQATRDPLIIGVFGTGAQY